LHHGEGALIPTYCNNPVVRLSRAASEAADKKRMREAGMRLAQGYLKRQFAVHEPRRGRPPRVDGAVFAKGAPGGNKHTIAAERWESSGCVPVFERTQDYRKSRRRRTAAIFGRNHDLDVVT
jgi:hypothetical protein